MAAMSDDRTYISSVCEAGAGVGTVSSGNAYTGATDSDVVCYAELTGHAASEAGIEYTMMSPSSADYSTYDLAGASE